MMKSERKRDIDANKFHSQETFKKRNVSVQTVKAITAVICVLLSVGFILWIFLWFHTTLLQLETRVQKLEMDCIKKESVYSVISDILESVSIDSLQNGHVGNVLSMYYLLIYYLWVSFEEIFKIYIKIWGMAAVR